ncbi:MAG TPA: serine hydrolase domain-containing protein [Puia sp.]|nr:serine hydrolase domain-containing protein [Puia sp.]
MNKILLSAFLLFFDCHPSSAQEQSKKNQPASSNPLITQSDKDIDGVVRQYLKSQKTVGLEIGILKDNKTLYYGYGETERGNRQLPDEHTIFEIGSITKTFTATLLAKAIVDGKMKLDDPVSKYLPDSLPVLEYRGMPATLQTIANHTSGIPGNPSNIKYPPEIKGVWSGDPFKDYDDNDLFSFYAHFKLKRKPGEKFEYSNLAFGTLGVMLERIYGKSFEQLVGEKISGPLGMVDTRQTVPPGDTPRVAHGYANNGQPAPAWHAKALAGCGALRSTASDLLRYAQAEIGQGPLQLTAAIALTQQATYRQKKFGLGLAWVIIRLDRTMGVLHGGTTGGFGSLLILIPNKKAALVILANNPLGVDDLAGDILSVMKKDEKLL